MKAVGYVRVSTSAQVEEGISIETQEAKIRAWAELNDVDEIQIYRDEGISGKRTDNRPALQEALVNVQTGDALVCYSLSRLSRSTKDTIILADKLDKAGADLVSLSEKIDTTTAAGKMVFRMLAVLSEFERDQVSERTKAALQYKKSNGEKTGGDVPFGYRLRGKKLIPNKREQKAVSLILNLRANGVSLRGICTELEKAGFRRRRGSKKWHPQIVSGIIRWQGGRYTAKARQASSEA